MEHTLEVDCINGSKEPDVPVQKCSEDCATKVEVNITKSSFDSLIQAKDFSESELFGFLNGLSESDLYLRLKDANHDNVILLRENDTYEFALNDVVQHKIELASEVNEDIPVDELSLLSWPFKCYYARNRLKCLHEDYEQEKSSSKNQLQELQFKLETLSRSLNALKASKETFNKNVRIGGQHPVTKKVILQKVAKFFDDSIKNMMAMTNRYKIQIQSNTMERNKLVSQIKEQEKRLVSLDLAKYQEAKFEHEKSCRSLVKHRDQLAKCKSKFSSLNQTVLETKRNLVKEKSNMEQMNAAVLKKEYMKNVMFSEKARNEEKVKKLNAAMRKMQLDPRRHDLPEISEYAKIKRENEVLKQNIVKWKKKVELVEQAKRLHLSAKKRRGLDDLKLH